MDTALGSMGLGIILTLRDQASNNLDKIRQKMASFSNVTKDTVKQFEDGAKRIAGGFAMMWGGAKTIGAFKNMFGAPIEVAASYEQAMARVAAVSGAVGKDFEALSAQARQLGRDTQFSATQAANAQELLARAGFQTGEILKSMPPLLSMASAEGMGIAEAADIAAGTLRGFGMEAAEMTRVANVLAKASASSNTSISTLGNALRNVAPDAAALGLEIEEVVAILGVMGDSAIKDGRAGTALASALSKISAPAESAQKALSKLGVATVDENGNLLKLPEILKNLSGVMNTRGLGSAERSAILKDLFGLATKTEMQVVMNAVDNDSFERLYDKLQNAGNAAGEMSKTMNNTLQGAMLRLQSASEGLQIALGNIFKPVYTWFIDKIAAVKSGITWLIEAFPTLSTIIIGGAGSVLLIAGAFLTLNGAIMAAQGALRVWRMAQMAAGSGMVKFINTPLMKGVRLFKIFRSYGHSVGESLRFIGIAAKDGLVDAIKGTLNALWSVSWPIKTLIVLAGLLFAAWKTNFGGFRDMITSISEGWNMAMSANADGITELDNDTIERLKKAGIWNSVVNMGKVFFRVREFFTGFKEGALDVINAVVAGFQWLGDVFKPFITGGTACLQILGILNPVVDTASETWKNVGRYVGIAVTSIIGLYGVYKTLRIATQAWTAAQWALNLAQRAGSGLWNVGKLVLYAAKTAVVTTATWAWSAAQWALSAAMNAGLLPILGIIAAIAALVAACYYLYNNWDTVCDALVAAWNWLWDVVKNFWNWLTGFFTLDFLAASWDAVVSVIASSWEWLKGYILPDWLVNFWDVLVIGWNNLIKIIKSGWNKLKSIFTLKGLSDLWQSLINGWNNAKSWILQGWESFKRWITPDWLRNFWNALVTGWETVKSTIKQKWEDFKSLLTLENLGKAWDILMSAWESAKGLILQGWESFKSLFTFETLSKVWDAFVTGWNEAKALIEQGWETLKGLFTFDWLSKTWDSLKSGFTELMNFIEGLWSSTIGRLTNLVGNLYDKVTGAAEWVWNGAKSLVGLGGDTAMNEQQMTAVQVQDMTMLNKMYEGFRDRVNEMSAAWTPFKQSLGEGFLNIYNVMKDIGAHIRSSVIPAVNELVTTLRQLAFELENVARAGGVNVQIPQNQAVQQREVTNHVLNWAGAAHAEGGIFTKPHLGLVAESGPEVIIPTSDPSRGIPLLTAAANAMGLNNRARNAENAAPILARMALNERGSENYNEHANRNLRSDKPTQVKNNVNLRMEAVTTPVYLDGDMIGQFITRFLEHQDMRNGSPALA